MNRRLVTVLVCSILSMGAAQAAELSGEELFESQCSSCHGASSAIPMVPILFGQEPAYLKFSLQSFQNDSRKDNILHVMNGLAKSLSARDVSSVTTYLASQDICQVKQEIDPDKDGFIEKFKAGRTLATENNCMHCHASFHHMAPRIFGQKKDYIQKSLQAFQSGERKNPMMKRFTEKLTAEDIDHLSTYLNGMILMRHCEE